MPESSVRLRRQALVARPDLRGVDFCRAYAADVDVWLASIAQRASGGSHRGVALVAVGGYGRGELCPYSDLDVVLVHDRRRDVAALAEAIWYPVWDEGLALDHSVRRPDEVLGAAASDMRVALGLLDARTIWGDARLAQPLIDASRELWRRQLGATMLPRLVERMEERHRAQGDVAFLLEPDLKEAHGGLRDVHALRAMAMWVEPAEPTRQTPGRRRTLVRDAVDLRGVDFSAVDRAATVLTGVRVELHRGAGRALDRLLLQEQDTVAHILGYTEADALMADVAEAGRAIAWACDNVWRPRPEGVRPPARARTRWSTRRPGLVSEGPVEEVESGLDLDDVVVVGGEATLSGLAAPGADPSLPLRLASVAAERSVPISADAIRRLGATFHVPDPWPDATREAFVGLLGRGHRAVYALEALDHEGLLVRFVPEWALVRNRPQRNAYHRFTVDRHLLETAAFGAGLVDRVTRPDLLLLGCLLHDIGKGVPGDHVRTGEVLVARIGRRMGLGHRDVATLITMCRLHLLLARTATRRDLDDPATVEATARAVADRDTLHLLWALTEADSLATGPSAWGPWKAGLVADLVERVEHHLAGRATPVRPGIVDSEHRRAVEEVRESGRLLVRLTPPRVVVAAPDRRGLLAAAAGTLALHGLDVRSADVTNDEGVALEVFTVEPGPGSWPSADDLRRDLEAVLSGQLALGDRLAEKERAYAGVRRPASAHRVAASVVFDMGASDTSTVVDVRARDELGLLHRLTRALFDSGLDVVSARVATVGDSVVDAFYVRDASGRKVDDARVLEDVRRAILAALG